MSTTTDAIENEMTILTRVLSDQSGRLSPDLARHILGLNFSQRDRDRMHDLAVRNQDDSLSPAEREELSAYGKAGDLLAILKSKARRALGMKPARPILS